MQSHSRQKSNLPYNPYAYQNAGLTANVIKRMLMRSALLRIKQTTINAFYLKGPITDLTISKVSLEAFLIADSISAGKPVAIAAMLSSVT